MPYACIDIGSNTTRLLVAERDGERLRELMAQRAFTRLGKGLKSGGKIGKRKIEELAEVVDTQARLARQLGADDVRVVATAAVRDAVNRDDVLEAVRSQAGVEVELLSGEEEARLSFIGATKTLGTPFDGQVCVIDVGGGSTETVLGTVADGVSWAESFRIGSGFLADSYLRSDPPSVQELEAVRLHVAGFFEGLNLPSPDHAIATGGSASSLRKVVGAEVEHETLERAIRILCTNEAAEVARRFELDPERVRLLPAGCLIFEDLSDRLELPLTIGKGGLREGVILDRLAAEAGLPR
jgi:exopolyphosphatase / guanosine-5'-triphosphate,3'-diphosphate pyrophosphatase